MGCGSVGATTTGATGEATAATMGAVSNASTAALCVRRLSSSSGGTLLAGDSRNAAPTALAATPSVASWVSSAAAWALMSASRRKCLRRLRHIRRVFRLSPYMCVRARARMGYNTKDLSKVSQVSQEAVRDMATARVLRMATQSHG